MIDRASVDAFVEKNAAYYFEKWTAISDGTNSRVNWNWAAAIGGMVWLLYRKLYLPAGIILVVGFTDIYLTAVLEDAGAFPVAVQFWDRISYWVYAAVLGSWGDYWYYQKFRKVNDSLLATPANTDDRLSALAKSGGTNIVIAGLFLMSVSALMIWAIIEP